MKNFILYYYNLEITDYISQDTYYYIETKTDIYYFCKVRKSEEELTKIYEELSNIIVILLNIIKNLIAYLKFVVF